MPEWKLPRWMEHTLWFTTCKKVWKLELEKPTKYSKDHRWNVTFEPCHEKRIEELILKYQKNNITQEEKDELILNLICKSSHIRKLHHEILKIIIEKHPNAIKKWRTQNIDETEYEIDAIINDYYDRLYEWITDKILSAIKEYKIEKKGSIYSFLANKICFYRSNKKYTFSRTCFRMEFLKEIPIRFICYKPVLKFEAELGNVFGKKRKAISEIKEKELYYDKEKNMLFYRVSDTVDKSKSLERVEGILKEKYKNYEDIKRNKKIKIEICCYKEIDGITFWTDAHKDIMVSKSIIFLTEEEFYKDVEHREKRGINELVLTYCPELIIVKEIPVPEPRDNDDDERGLDGIVKQIVKGFIVQENGKDERAEKVNVFEAVPTVPSKDDNTALFLRDMIILTMRSIAKDYKHFQRVVTHDRYKDKLTDTYRQNARQAKHRIKEKIKSGDYLIKFFKKRLIEELNCMKVLLNIELSEKDIDKIASQLLEKSEKIIKVFEEIKRIEYKKFDKLKDEDLEKLNKMRLQKILPDEEMNELFWKFFLNGPETDEYKKSQEKIITILTLKEILPPDLSADILMNAFKYFLKGSAFILCRTKKDEIKIMAMSNKNKENCKTHPIEVSKEDFQKFGEEMEISELDLLDEECLTKIAWKYYETVGILDDGSAANNLRKEKFKQKFPEILRELNCEKNFLNIIDIDAIGWENLNFEFYFKKFESIIRQI